MKKFEPVIGFLVDGSTKVKIECGFAVLAFMFCYISVFSPAFDHIFCNVTVYDFPY